MGYRENIISKNNQYAKILSKNNSSIVQPHASSDYVVRLRSTLASSLGVWQEESLVYTVCACANSGGIPPAPVTIPYTIVHQLDNELFIQVGITASPSATFDKAVWYAPQHLFCPYLRLGPAYGTARSKISAVLQRGAT